MATLGESLRKCSAISIKLLFVLNFKNAECENREGRKGPSMRNEKCGENGTHRATGLRKH